MVLRFVDMHEPVVPLVFFRIQAMFEYQGPQTLTRAEIITPLLATTLT